MPPGTSANAAAVNWLEMVAISSLGIHDGRAGSFRPIELTVTFATSTVSVFTCANFSSATAFAKLPSTSARDSGVASLNNQ